MDADASRRRAHPARPASGAARA
ncbi:Endonuclease III [Caballeronia sordidicola]|uniref:Endonuclease III n=1 Tax=Caballeronia sordidicola TaxID=196367 RepID=A0A242MF73_CABSO|nr:Endonuclease III [Caballeronia sordidicola]OTP80856.1 Endonuclease III [Caballeronia sordidicola]